MAFGVRLRFQSPRSEAQKDKSQKPITFSLCRFCGDSFWNPNPHIQGKHMNNNLAPQAAKLALFQSIWGSILSRFFFIVLPCMWGGVTSVFLSFGGTTLGLPTEGTAVRTLHWACLDWSHVSKLPGFTFKLGPPSPLALLLFLPVMAETARSGCSTTWKKSEVKQAHKLCQDKLVLHPLPQQGPGFSRCCLSRL